MKHFNKIIKTSEGEINFYFNFLNTPSGKGYHVCFIDKDKKVKIFYMHYESKWVLSRQGDNPDWINSIELKLASIIDEQTKKT